MIKEVVQKIFWGFFLSISIFTFSQNKGIPYYRVYEPLEYRGHRQNWAIAQGEDGTMFFANEGLLAFNGEKWELNMVPNQRRLRSLAIGHDRIYAGGGNEFGYFKKDRDKYEFTSHAHHIPDSLKNFDRVWTTLVHKESVYYQTDTFVVRVSLDGTSKLWPFIKNRVWKLLLIEDHIYVDVPFEGFHILNASDEFELVPNGDELKMVGMEFFLPVGDRWLFEQRDTLKLFDGRKVSIFKNEASDIFLEYGLDNGIKTRSGDLIFSTRRKGGVVILNEDGTLKKHLISGNGFSNEIVRNLFEDNQGSIWFALDTGISRLDLSSPLRYYTSSIGLNGTTTAIQEFNETLYFGSTDGLKVLNQSNFDYVSSITSLVQDLEVVQNQLIVATSRDKLYAINADDDIAIIDHSNTNSKGIFLEILRPEEDDLSFICLYEEGLFQARWEENEWVIKQELKGVFKDAQNILQEEPGKLWIDTGIAGFYRISYEVLPSGEFDFKNASVKNYYVDQGIPKGRSTIYLLHDELIVTSAEDYLIKYDKKKDLFKKATDIFRAWGYEGKNDSIIGLRRSGQKHSIWLEIQKQGKPFLLNIKKVGKGYEHFFYPLNTYATRFGDLRGARAFQVEKGKVYYGGIKGAVEYDIKNAHKIANKVSIHIAEASTSDTTYYDLGQKHTLNDIKFDNIRLSFVYASTNFKDAANKTYQYKLEGFDDNWSQASTTNTKEYTTLPPGDYTFRVKALNDYFMESPEALVNFTVNPPWFWNSISITLYVLALIGFTYLFSLWRNRNLKLQNRRLEEAVNNAVVETKRQAEEIEKLYQVKNQFFSNISHELRTPLTLILGPSTDLLGDESLSAKQKNGLTFIHNNAKRLLRLINQLLDLSKLEAGRLELKVSQQNIVKFIATLTESFDSMAASRGIRLQFQTTPKELFVFFDPDKLEQIMINLLSNALKFTKKGGRVIVSVEKQNQLCQIKVKDSGIGINEEQLPYIFDRFYQADNSESREHEGTGIGLSLTKELVELHGGTIHVSSITGKGTTFHLEIPLGKTHFEAHQLAKLQPVPSDVSASKMEAIVQENISETPEDNEGVVLLVEDNTEMRTYIKGLMQHDYHILEAANGLEGFEIAKEKVPDLIISDVMMPKMDGTELCKKLKNHNVTAHIPVILLTAKASEKDRIAGLNIEADAYLAKPFNKEELQVQVKNLILNRKKLQKRFAKSTLITPKEIAITSMEQQFLEKLIADIEKNIGDENFGVEQLAQAVHLSRSQLHRKMISITNQTPSYFLRKYRLERAKQLLEKGAGRVADIAFQVGFSSPSYFTKCYVEAFGQTPKETSKSEG